PLRGSASPPAALVFGSAATVAPNPAATAWTPAEDCRRPSCELDARCALWLIDVCGTYSCLQRSEDETPTLRFSARSWVFLTWGRHSQTRCQRRRSTLDRAYSKLRRDRLGITMSDKQSPECRAMQLARQDERPLQEHSFCNQTRRPARDQRG